MSDASTLPTTGLELRSTVTDDGAVILGLRQTDIAAPGDDQVLVRIEAAPINPSDLGMMFAMADLSEAEAADGELPGVQATVPAGAVQAMQARVGHPMPVGNEGGGVVVAAGSSDESQAMLGRTVGFVSGNSYSQYQTLPAASCLVMPEGTTPEQAAAPFVNPTPTLVPRDRRPRRRTSRGCGSWVSHPSVHGVG